MHLIIIYNIYNLNFIDTSKITDMSFLFYTYINGNLDVSNWDMPNVTKADHMFYKCKTFNCDLSNWDVSNIKNMKNMFAGCEKFEGKGLKNWNLKNVVMYYDITLYVLTHSNGIMRIGVV